MIAIIRVAQSTEPNKQVCRLQRWRNKAEPSQGLQKKEQRRMSEKMLR